MSQVTKKHSRAIYISPSCSCRYSIKLKLDTSIITGLLHDTLEDTLATENEIEEKFGKEVLQLVNGVTKLSKLKRILKINSRLKTSEN